MSPSLAPYVRVAVLVPVIDGPRYGFLDLLPALEEASLYGQRSERLPSGLDEVEVRRLLGLEDELPPRVGHVEQQNVVGFVGAEVVHDGVDPPYAFGHPRLDPLQEVHKRDDRAAGVGGPLLAKLAPGAKYRSDWKASPDGFGLGPLLDRAAVQVEKGIHLEPEGTLGVGL
jgi:hypothetical protein